MKKKIIFLLISGLTLCSFFLDTANLYEGLGSRENPFSIELFPMTICFLFFYFFYSKKEGKISWIEKLMVSFFSISMLIGNSYMKIGSWNLVFGNLLFFFLSIFLFFGYYFFFKQCLLYFRMFLEKKEKKDGKIKNKFLLFFEQKPFLSSFLFLLLIFSIYLIAFYPMILSKDPSFQILQFYNIKNKYSDYVVLLDPNVHLTNHHPVLHTLLLGGFLNIGKFFGNDNFGLFLYSLFQMLWLIGALSFTISYMKKVKVSLKKRLIVLAIYAFVPMYAFYALSSVKDTFYTVFLLFYFVFLYDFIKFYKEKPYPLKKCLLLFLIVFLISAFRNNGIYVLVLSLPFLFFYTKKNKKQIGAIFVFLCLTYFGYTKILFPYFKITDGSIREALSIPFQQTARYVKEHEDEVTKEEREAIDQILTYDTLKDRYKPEIADPVKNEFNRYSTKEDLIRYFKVWFQEFLKHPDTYVQATLHNIYGYFYPNKKNWYIYSAYTSIIKDWDVADYHYNSLKPMRTVLTAYGESFPYFPVVGLLSNIGFQTWMILIMSVYFLIYKKKKYLLLLLPAYVTILICIASPVNCYFRYAMPYIFAIPFLFTVFLKEIREK